jgi:hypothetical protein
MLDNDRHLHVLNFARVEQFGWAWQKQHALIAGVFDEKKDIKPL